MTGGSLQSGIFNLGSPVGVQPPSALASFETWQMCLSSATPAQLGSFRLLIWFLTPFSVDTTARHRVAQHSKRSGPLFTPREKWYTGLCTTPPGSGKARATAHPARNACWQKRRALSPAADADACKLDLVHLYSSC